MSQPASGDQTQVDLPDCYIDTLKIVTEEKLIKVVVAKFKATACCSLTLV